MKNLFEMFKNYALQSWYDFYRCCISHYLNESIAHFRAIQILDMTNPHQVSWPCWAGPTRSSRLRTCGCSSATEGVPYTASSSCYCLLCQGYPRQQGRVWIAITTIRPWPTRNVHDAHSLFGTCSMTDMHRIDWFFNGYWLQFSPL